MAATTPYCTFKNVETGQTVTLGLYYAGADAVGYIVPCSFSGVASANSPKDFKLPSGIWTIQYISGPATGKIRLWCNGAPGPVALDMQSVIAMAASGVTYGRFRGGSQFAYMFVVESAMAA